MQCFVCVACVACVVMFCAAQPPAAPEERSLFRDVVESLRIRSHLPEDDDPSDDNNLSQHYDRYGFDNEPPELPGDADFVPRRNDRIEMPTLKYRFPKALDANGSEIKEENKMEDIILYMNTPAGRPGPRPTTHKPKREPKPNSKVNYVKEGTVATDLETEVVDDGPRPLINRMEDSSQIGNREYQTVIKPTVIVNFRGTVSHRDSEIRLEKRNSPKRKQNYDSARNIFNINQEIKVERPNPTLDMEELRHLRQEVKQGVRVLPARVSAEDDNMTMCETSPSPAGVAEEAEEAERAPRESDSVLQIIVTL